MHCQKIKKEASTYQIGATWQNVNFAEKKFFCLFSVPSVKDISALNIDFQKTIHALKHLQGPHLDIGKQKSANSKPKKCRCLWVGYGPKRPQVVQSVHQNECRPQLIAGKKSTIYVSIAASNGNNQNLFHNNL